MNKLVGISALVAVAATGCVSIDKYHEGPVDPQLGLEDCSANP